MSKLVLTAITLLMVPLCFEPAGAIPLDARGFSASSNVTPVRMAVRGPHGGVAVRGPHGVAVRGPHGGVAVRGAHHVGGRYYGGVWTVMPDVGTVAAGGPMASAVAGGRLRSATFGSAVEK